MAVAPATSPLPSRRPLQFTLGGMLLTFCLVFSVGLGYWRWEDVTFCSAMLLSFSIWLGVGLIQLIRQRSRQLGNWNGLPRERRWGQVLQLVVPLWSITLLAVVAFSEIQRRYGWSSSGLQYEVADILFFLAIVIAYWRPRAETSASSARPRAARAAFSISMIIVLTLWMRAIVATQARIFRLIYTSLRNVERAQPTMFAGRPFTPSKLTVGVDALEATLSQLTVASYFAIAAVAVGALILYLWRSRTRLKLLLLATWLLCLCMAGVCLRAAWYTGAADVSPVRLAELLRVSATDGLFLSILFGTLLTAGSLHFAAGEVNAGAITADFAAGSPAILHERTGVLGFGLFAVCGQFLETFVEKGSNMNSAMPAGSWIFGPTVVWPTLKTLSLDFALYMPYSMIHVAAALVLTRSFWQARHESQRAAVVWSLDVNKFTAVWLLSLVTLALAAPIAVWWGVISTLLN